METCSPVCSRIWEKTRYGHDPPRYDTWLQNQLYDSLSTTAIDLCGVLHEAATAGHESCLRKLLDLGFCPDTRCESGVTPLIKAVKSGWTECVSVLLSAGAKVNDRAADKTTALMHAVAAGQDNCVKVLLTAGANVNIKYKIGSCCEMTAVSLAATTGQLHLFEMMIKHFGTYNWKNAVDVQWLHELISKRPTFYVKRLLDVIIQHIGGLPWSVYEHVALEDKSTLLLFLIKKKLPLLEAKGRSVDVRKLLYSCVESPETGILCLTELLQSVDDLGLNLQNFMFDSTLLQYSCEMLNYEAISMLLQNGVNVVDDLNDSSETCIKECIRGMARNPSMALMCLAVMIRHGCDVEKTFPASCAFPPGDFNLTPMEYALSGKNLYAAEMLSLGMQTVCKPKSPHLKGSLRECIIPYPLQCTQEELSAYVTQISTPFSLYHMTRAHVRKTIGFNPSGKIANLPLPKNLKASLNLGEIDQLIIQFENAKAIFAHL